MEGSRGDRQEPERSGRAPPTEAGPAGESARARSLRAASKWVAGAILAPVAVALIVWVVTRDTESPEKPRPRFKTFGELVDFDTRRRATLETRIANTGDRRAEIIRFEFFYAPTGELGGLRPSPEGLDRFERSRSDRLPKV